MLLLIIKKNGMSSWKQLEYGASFAKIANMVQFVTVGEVFKGLAPISILMGVGVGFFGSLLTTHKHLRV